MIPEKRKQGKGLTDKAYCASILQNQNNLNMNSRSFLGMVSGILAILAAGIMGYAAYNAPPDTITVKLFLGVAHSLVTALMSIAFAVLSLSEKE